MNPIPNSPYKETIRKQYEQQAADEERRINDKLNRDIFAIQQDSREKTKDMKRREYLWEDGSIGVGGIIYGFAMAVVMLGFIIAGLGMTLSGMGSWFRFRFRNGFYISAFICIVFFLFHCYRVKTKNADMESCRLRIMMEEEDKIQKLRNQAASRINLAYAEADRKTRNDIAQYDADVKKNCRMILKDPDAFSAMVNHVVDMFQRMVSHADSASNRKFVEADLTYIVTQYGIIYRYQSTYSNPQDDFNFDRERYRNLTTQEECEGLAQAIAKMTVGRMKGLYPPNSLNITVSHIDAEVTLHFKAANINYVPPRDIYSRV